MDAVLASFGVVFLAELGDKSQLLALAFAARFRPAQVLAGIAAAAAAVNLASVVLGAAAGRQLPAGALRLGAAAAFVGFAVWTWWGDRPRTGGPPPPRAGGRSPVLAVAGAFALAEVGDKTMLATATLAATAGPLGTWAGSTLAMVAADALAIWAGARLVARLPERAVRAGAAAAFAVVGVVLAVEALTG